MKVGQVCEEFQKQGKSKQNQKKDDILNLNSLMGGSDKSLEDQKFALQNLKDLVEKQESLYKKLEKDLS